MISYAQTPKRHAPRHIEAPQGYPGGPNGPAAVCSKTRPGAGGHVEMRGVPEPSGSGPDILPHALFNGINKQ
jgi:hypothetical protein